MKDYVRWLHSLPGKPVFVAYPAGFDFLFIYWYLIRFTGESPFEFSAIDIKTYAMALLGLDFWATTKRAFPYCAGRCAGAGGDVYENAFGKPTAIKRLCATNFARRLPMPCICYVERSFSSGVKKIIEQANEIIKHYAAQGYDLTLRQLFYQFVSRDLLPNTQQSYKRLGSIINDARLAGLIDWSTIVDRTRNLRQLAHWDSPADIVNACASQFRVDKWEGQPFRLECFEPTTPVRTKDGFVDIGSVQVGDLVLAHTGKWRRVTKVIRNAYKGKLLRVSAAGALPFLVTPNHPLYARPFDDSCPGYKGSTRKFHGLQWVHAQELKKYDRLLVPFQKARSTKHRERSIITLHSSKRAKRVEVTLNETCMQVLGLYVAEGSIRGDGRTVQFTFGAHEPQHASLIEKWACTLNINTHRVLNNGALTVYVFSKSLADWLSTEFSNGAYNKRVPSWLVNLPSEESLPFLEYYFRGDGCFWDESRAAIAATTRSRNLALLVQTMLLESGYQASVDILEDSGAPRYRVSVGGAAADRLAELWHVSVPEKGRKRSRRYNHIVYTDVGFEFPVRKVEEVDYCGDVINLEVAVDHSYCAPVAVHNCWIEKDALVGVIAGICNTLDVPYFSCRGYTSQSEMWAAAQRLKKYVQQRQQPYIIHLGDHDPSGIDMSRDIRDRLSMFAGFPVSVERIALTMSQVEHYDPPPNPAKITDSRAAEYIDRWGEESWELDALEPRVIEDLIRMHVESHRDDRPWQQAIEREQQGRIRLEELAAELDE